MSIRTRLVLVLLSALLPALGGAVWLIAHTFQAEREAQQRTLRDMARALSMVVDHELSHRATVARVLALSRNLDGAPDVAAEQLAGFQNEARRALFGLGGWVELLDNGRLIFDSRAAAAAPPAATAAPTPARPVAASASDAARGFVDAAVVRPLQRDDKGRQSAALAVPVQRNGRDLLELRVTIVPEELQRLLDAQQLPADRSASVVDNRGVIVASHPDGTAAVGQMASAAVLAGRAAQPEGPFESVSADGVPTRGYYSTSAQGWTYFSTIGSGPGARLPDAAPQAVAAVLGLLALAALWAWWVSRSIAAPVRSLKQAAEQMKSGQPVVQAPTGITECDEVALALADAAAAIHRSRVELEQQVDRAVVRTRDAEQRIAHSQRLEALGRLTGGVAHDFNNLLGVISNSSHLIERQAPQLAPGPLAAIQRSVDVGSRLTQHLLRFAGRRPPRPQQVDLARYLPEVQELLRSVLGKRIEFSCAVSPGTLPITVDPGELELALVNLALNARDAMRGGGHVWVRAATATADDGAGPAAVPQVLITFTDDGVGMDADLAERVFEPFFTTKQAGAGTGFGLSQVHGFCAQAGGIARLGSTPGLGTTVSMLLPAAVDEAATPAPPPQTLPAAAPAVVGARVVLVEDNDELAAVTVALLAAYGCTVRHAPSAEQALRLLDEPAGVDVVVSDIVMPGGMDGVALARELRRQRPELPVLLMTGYTSALAAANDFIVLHKPYTQESLLTALQQVLAPRGLTAPP